MKLEEILRKRLNEGSTFITGFEAIEAIERLEQLQAELDKLNRDPGEWPYQTHLWAKTKDEFLEKLDCLFGDELATLRWIPVEERLPEDSETVLIACGESDWLEQAYRGKSIHSDEIIWLRAGYASGRITNVTHWMPIILPNNAVKSRME
ncbi:MAG: DUF551 domain-containing protein [Candidatus Scalindua sp.]